MRKLFAGDVNKVMECLGYYADEPGLYITSGKVAGPKGCIVGPLQDDEYVTGEEFVEFLVERVQLLEEDVRECVYAR